MHGLPTPAQLAEMDEFLSGEEVTVQAQYGFTGDSQSEMRVAEYDAENDVWLADIPNTYLTKNAPVHVYVYVMHGVKENLSRSKTCYEAVFTPISRPAPNTQVTPEQGNAWEILMEEINLTMSAMNTATSNANAATEEARTAIDEANTVTEKLDSLAVTASTLTPGSEATAEITDQGWRKVIAFGIPQGARGETGAQGEKGEKGDKGDTGATGPAGVTFRLDGTTLYIDTV